MYTIGNTRSPIGLEAEHFSKYILADEISAAALCKARQKVKYTAFKELFKQTAQITQRTNCFHGYHLYAVDGMKGELPKTLELSEKYRASTNPDIPMFHAVSVFDVLNEVFIDSINANYSDEPQIWIFDRGFPSLILLQKLFENNLKFVMRVSKSFIKEVNEFRESKYVDREVHVKYTKQRLHRNHVKPDGICEFNLRCVRIKLSKGEDEILVTNLERKDFPKRDIKEIYHLRWGIETSFNYLKNAVFVEEFATRSENGIAQDYYVSLLMYNFSTCICGSMYHDIPKKENTSTK